MNVNKQELIKALEIVKPGLSNKENNIDQATHFAFIDGKVVTYNDSISISHPLEGLEISGAIRGEELYELLGKIKTEEVEFEISDSELRIQAGRIKAGIRMEQEVSMPLQELGDISDNWKKLPTNFIPLLQMAYPNASNDMSDPRLTGVNIKKDGYIQASDGLKLIQCQLNKEMPVPTFLLPKASCPFVVKMNPDSINKGGAWVHFKNKQGTILSCRLHPEEYVVFSKHMNIKNAKEIAFPKHFKDSINRASIFAKRDKQSEEEVLVTLANNRIKVKGQSDYGWIEEEAGIKYKDEPLNIIFNPYLVYEILSETTTAQISGNKIVFQGENWTYVALLKG